MYKRGLLFLSSLSAIVVLSIMLVRHTGPTNLSLASALLPSIGLQDATTSLQVGRDTGTIPSVIDVLQQLQDQEQSLANDVETLRSQVQTVRLQNIFTRALKRGDSGDDVKTLQDLLSSVSGVAATSTVFYGTLTERAVKNFQTSIGLKGTGIFDSGTRDALISLVGNQTDSISSTKISVPIDLSTLSDSTQAVQTLQDQVSQLTSKSSDQDIAIQSLKDKISSLESNLTDVQSTVGNLASTPPPTPVALPLAISTIQVSSTTKSSATIVWTTNNPATSEVDYSQNSNMPVSQTLTVSNVAMTTNHSSALSSLTSGTIYYYRIISKDTSNTIANSSTLTFTTHTH